VRAGAVATVQALQEEIGIVQEVVALHQDAEIGLTIPIHVARDEGVAPLTASRNSPACTEIDLVGAELEVGNRVASALGHGAVRQRLIDEGVASAIETAAREYIGTFASNQCIGTDPSEELIVAIEAKQAIEAPVPHQHVRRAIAKDAVVTSTAGGVFKAGDGVPFYETPTNLVTLRSVGCDGRHVTVSYVVEINEHVRRRTACVVKVDALAAIDGVRAIHAADRERPIGVVASREADSLGRTQRENAILLALSPQNPEFSWIKLSSRRSM
jgi:hypothetical protein